MFLLPVVMAQGKPLTAAQFMQRTGTATGSAVIALAMLLSITKADTG
jgi:hypothetical protein